MFSANFAATARNATILNGLKPAGLCCDEMLAVAIVFRT
jgi:hypothetical protein